MKKIIFILFFAICAYSNVGTIVDISGQVYITRGGKSIKAHIKQSLENKDTIKTTKNSSVKIFFKDQTAVSLGEKTTFSISDYNFSSKRKATAKFKIIKGFFKTVTGKIGKIAPKRFKLVTKNATIGIRGTVFAGSVNDKNEIIICTDGEIVLFTPNGDVDVPAGKRGVVSGREKIKVTKFTEEQKREIVYKSGWHGTMSTRELIEFIKRNFKEPLRSQLLSTIYNILQKDSEEKRDFTKKVENADDIGYIDDITINGREFDTLDDRDIEFYRDDLEDGKVTVQGLLESDDKNTPVDNLFVEISTDGGDTWSRANGHGEWDWSFRPDLGKSYHFKIRVVKVTNEDNDFMFAQNQQETPQETQEENQSSSSSGTQQASNGSLPHTLTIAGFTLTLGNNVTLQNGKISGSGTITIPYLGQISSLGSNDLPVTFTNLSYSSGKVTVGDITFNQPFTISTPILDLHVDSITFSPTIANNKINGTITFNSSIFQTLNNESIPLNSRLFPDHFTLNIPFSGRSINIWEEKNVALDITSGSVEISYQVGDSVPHVSFNLPNAQIDFGDLLKDTNGVAYKASINSLNNINLSIPKDLLLFGTTLKLPSGFHIGGDLSDLSNPILNLSGNIDLSQYENSIINGISSAQLSATLQKTGFDGSITFNGSLNPITIIDRGSEQKNVRLVFAGNNPSVSLSFHNGDVSPNFSYSGITPKIYFGDLLKDANTQASNLFATINDIKHPHINISNALNLLGSKIRLPQGIDADIDLSDMHNPVISFNVAVDFSQYDNIIAKKLQNAQISGTISKSGFIADITANKPSPIDIYPEKNVKVIFEGTGSPTLHIEVKAAAQLPKVEISDINAKLDFGDLLKDVNNASNSVLADISTLEDQPDSLQIALPAKVRLLDSKVKLSNSIVNLDIHNKSISVSSSLDLSEYSSNPVISAIDGSTINATIDASGFSGEITATGGISPIDIWAEHGVKLTINGTPSISLQIGTHGVSFNFGSLDASIDFGDLLHQASQAGHYIASLQNATNNNGEYKINFSNKLYLLDSKFGIENGFISINPSKKSISLSATARLDEYNTPIIKAFDNSTFSATLSPSGFEGNITKNGGFTPIVLLDRGGSGKDISLDFTSSPTISFSILNSGIHFGIDGGGANINFGEFLGGATASLSSIQHGVYSWGISGKNKLFSSAKAYVENITNAQLDISNIKDPKISFNAKVDLSQYGGIFSTMTAVNLENVMISKEGFNATISPVLSDLDIWKEKHVALHFTKNPSISIKLQGSDFKMGFSSLNAQLKFGDLLNNSIADIEDLTDSSSDSLHKTYSWSINQADIPLMNSGINLNALSGTLNLEDLTDPIITLNATADLSHYSDIFKFVNSASLEDVTISKHEFSGNLNLTLQDIDVWKDKNVKLHFTQNPSFYLKINSQGIKVGAKSVKANLNFGDLLNNSIADIHSVGNDTYAFSLAGDNALAGSPVHISNLAGQINLSDLKDPIVELNATASIPSMGSKFQGVSLKNATISKSGFDGDLSVLLDDINLYSEDSKKVDLKFVNNSPATLHLTLTREDFHMGISDLNAKLSFTNMLNNQQIPLVPLMKEGVRVPRTFSWSIAGPINFVNDSKGVIPVTNMQGSIDLTSWSNPVVTFATTADFTNYHFSNNINLGIVSVENALIKKDRIEWNLSVTNASANFTILDLGTGPNDDVRVELKNISGNVGTGGNSLNSGDGTLFFGKLFEGNKQASLSYNKAENGLKTYTFSLDDELVYKKDDNNFIRFNGVSGTLTEVSKDHYKVSINSQAIIRSSILQAINIDSVEAENLDISNTGFKGDITAVWASKNINILEGKATLELKNLGVHIDSSQSMPISLNQFGGNLSINSLFDQPQAKANIEYLQSSHQINWSFPQNQQLTISQNFEFKNLSGSISIDSIQSLSVEFSGKFGYKGIQSDINLQDFTINRDGIHGSVSLDSAVTLYNNLKLTKLQVAFAGSNTSGSAELTYNNSSFLGSNKPLNIALAATVDRTGIKDFTIKGNLQAINIPNFANITFTSISTSSSFSNFWVKMSGSIKPQNPLFSAASDLEFKNLKISHSGVSVESAGVMINTSGASASLAGLSMHVDKLGIGFENNLFYLKAQGGISLDIVSADGGVTLYSNKHIHVDNISVDIQTSGVIGKGTLVWYDNDSTYGNGFKATLQMNVAQLITASGEFRIGKKDSIFYWAANLSAGTSGGIPLSPIPLNIYEIGGGVAYHMVYNESKKDFIPNASGFALMLSTYMGTSSDNGYMWNGQIKITASFSNGNLNNLVLQGDSWLMCNLHSNPSDRKVSASMVISTSPASFHMTATANVKYHGITVKGSLDAMFSSSEKHIFVGTDQDYAFAFHIDQELGYVSVGMFGIEGYGFFMANTSALAVGEGIKYKKTWKKSWPGPDPKLEVDFNAMAKGLLIYRPTFQLYIDAFAELGLKACYGYCLNLGCDLNLKLATPNPDYLYAKIKFSAFNHDFTFSKYIYGSGEIQEADTYTPTILNRIEPSSGTTIGILPVFKVYTNFFKDQPVQISFSNVILKDSYNHIIPVDIYTLDEDNIGISITPKTVLVKNRSYAITGKINLLYTENGQQKSAQEDFNMAYTTKNNDNVDFDTLVKSLTPYNNQNNVNEDTRVELKYNKDIINRLGGFNNQYLDRYKITLYDSDDNIIAGYFTPANTTTYTSTFVPSKALRVYRYCVNQSGEIRETFVLNGKYLNPFNNYKVDNGVDNIPEGLKNMQNHTSQNVSTSAPGGNIPYMAPNSSQNNNNSPSVSSNLINTQAQATNVANVASVQVPSYIRKGPITLKSPEALGDLVYSDYNDGKIYRYYRANKYKIVVRYYAPNQQPKIVKSSTFEIKYNNAIKEAKRKIEQMHDNLDPTLTVSFDKHRLGNSSPSFTPPTCKSSNFNGGFYNEVRVHIDDALLDIGITSGIKTEVSSSWEIETKNGGTQTIQKVIHDGDKFFLPGIVQGYSATIKYLSETDNKLLYQTDLRLISGYPFDSCREKMEGMGSKVEKNMKNLQNALNTGSPGPQSGTFGNGFSSDPGGVFNNNTFTGNFNNNLGL